MTLFQTFSVWALRALALWAIIEIGAAFYGEASDQLSAWRQLEGHRAAMQRLDSQAEAAETRLSEMQGQIGARQRRVTFELPANATAADAAQMLRDELMALGAQAPVIDAEGSPLGGGLSKITFQARWRENATSSPSVLQALTAQRGAMQVRELQMTRTDGGQVNVDARFEALARATREANP